MVKIYTQFNLSDGIPLFSCEFVPFCGGLVILRNSMP